MHRFYFSVENIRLLIRALKARYRDQKTELDFIKQHVGPNDTVCDIGANKGSFTYWLSGWCGKVVAFEPQPELANRLVRLCRSLKLSNVTVEPKAVYSLSANLDFYMPGQNQPGASLKPITSANCTKTTVQAISLDEYFNDNTKIKLIKIDVEGAELHVLKGAEKLLRRSNPLLVFECENRHLNNGNVYDTFSYLKDLGYEGKFVYHGHLLPISKFNASIHQSQRGKSFWKSKDYCNNFIFTPMAQLPPKVNFTI